MVCDATRVRPGLKKCLQILVYQREPAAKSSQENGTRTGTRSILLWTTHHKITTMTSRIASFGTRFAARRMALRNRRRDLSSQARRRRVETYRKAPRPIHIYTKTQDLATRKVWNSSLANDEGNATLPNLDHDDPSLEIVTNILGFMFPGDDGNTTTRCLGRSSIPAAVVQLILFQILKEATTGEQSRTK